MNDKTPTALDRLLDQVPVGQAPIGDLLVAGHAAKRRQRRTLIAGVAAATVLILGGGTIATQALGKGDNDGHADESELTGDTTTPKHTITVQTSLEGPKIYYFEGALTEVSISSENDGDATAPATSDPAFVGWTDTWVDLPEGHYTIAAAVLPCGGNCDVLDAPTDSCEQSLYLTRNTHLDVTFHYGRPCDITIDLAETRTIPITPAIASLVIKEALYGQAWRPLGRYVPKIGGFENSPDRGTVKFMPDGTWSGFDGCNGAGGTYKLTSNKLKMSGGAVTDIGCANMSSEELLNGALLTVDPSGTHLTATDLNGNVIVEYAR